MQSDYTNVDAASDRIAYLQRDGFDLAKLELLRIESPSVTSEPDYRPVTEDDWQSWLDTIAAARVCENSVPRCGRPLTPGLSPCPGHLTPSCGIFISPLDFCRAHDIVV